MQLIQKVFSQNCLSIDVLLHDDETTTNYFFHPIIVTSACLLAEMVLIACSGSQVRSFPRESHFVTTPFINLLPE